MNSENINTWSWSTWWSVYARKLSEVYYKNVFCDQTHMLMKLDWLSFIHPTVGKFTWYSSSLLKSTQWYLLNKQWYTLHKKTRHILDGTTARFRSCRCHGWRSLLLKELLREPTVSSRGWEMLAMMNVSLVNNFLSPHDLRGIQRTV